MANPYKNTGKCGTKSPVKQQDEIRTMEDFEPQQLGGSPSGMFMIPMGIYHRYSDAKKELEKNQINQNLLKYGGDFQANIKKLATDPNFSLVNPNERGEAMINVESTKVDNTPPGALSEDPDMKI